MLTTNRVFFQKSRTKVKIGIFEAGIIIVIFQLILFSGFLFLSYRKNKANFFLGILLLSQAMGIFQGFCHIQRDFFITNLPNIFFLGYSFVFLWGPTFYIYVKKAAYGKRQKKSVFLHGIPFLIFFIFLSVTFFFKSPEYLREILITRNFLLITHSGFLDILLRIHVLIYILGSVKILMDVNEKVKNNYSSVSQSNYSWIRFLVVGFIACYCLTIPIILYVHFSGAYYHYYLSFFISLPYFIFFNIIFFKGWSHPELFSGIQDSTKYKYSKLTKDEAGKLINSLNDYVENEKPFLDCDLTLNELAEGINLSPRILSQIINEYFGQNFYDYINKLRVEESKKRLADSSSNKTILEILYEVGFNSKSAYNSAFKKLTGLTPTEFRKRNTRS